MIWEKQQQEDRSTFDYFYEHAIGKKVRLVICGEATECCPTVMEPSRRNRDLSTFTGRSESGTIWHNYNLIGGLDCTKIHHWIIVD